MDDELKKILVQLLEGQESLKLGQESLKLGQEEMRKDIARLGAKIDGEISDKLKILSEEQSIIRKDIAEINQGRIEDRAIIQDIKLTVDALSRNQNEQGNKIIELDKRMAK